MNNQEPVVVGGRYELGELLGRGGMAEVRKGTDTRLGRVVAVKRLRTDLASDATFQARFRRESQAAAGINDPHVVPIHGYGEIDGRLYLDMRLIEGRNLGTMLQETEKPLGAAFAAREIGMNRTMLFIGDGSLQLTVQELSVMLRHGLRPIVFVLNNAGCVVFFPTNEYFEQLVRRCVLLDQY